MSDRPIDEGPEVERLNPEAFTDFASRAGEGPVVMLNLLAFKPDGGAERYVEYGAEVQHHLDRVGGRLLSAYAASPTLIGDEEWDMVLLVEYPTRQAFLDMVSDAGYQAIGRLRTEALARAALVPMDAAPPPLGD